ncbi:hypothetical protein Tdes44962_MAKER08131 [Teratosphaeria destructans]|uniref:Uncharacterized protein n=1 Tax=Teratosphaeria destructans TaxID=418781 RepID=A0A9W7SXW5_9PEZI|nr:hypothetical protein Tdes44962_MAKER08131 [Teratosphaeria destructans]
MSSSYQPGQHYHGPSPVPNGRLDAAKQRHRDQERSASQTPTPSNISSSSPAISTAGPGQLFADVEEVARREGRWIGRTGGWGEQDQETHDDATPPPAETPPPPPGGWSTDFPEEEGQSPPPPPGGWSTGFPEEEGETIDGAADEREAVGEMEEVVDVIAERVRRYTRDDEGGMAPPASAHDGRVDDIIDDRPRRYVRDNKDRSATVHDRAKYPSLDPERYESPKLDPEPAVGGNPSRQSFVEDDDKDPPTASFDRSFRSRQQLTVKGDDESFPLSAAERREGGRRGGGAGGGMVGRDGPESTGGRGGDGRIPACGEGQDGGPSPARGEEQDVGASAVNLKRPARWWLLAPLLLLLLLFPYLIGFTIHHTLPFPTITTAHLTTFDPTDMHPLLTHLDAILTHIDLHASTYDPIIFAPCAALELQCHLADLDSSNSNILDRAFWPEYTRRTSRNGSTPVDAESIHGWDEGSQFCPVMEPCTHALHLSRTIARGFRTPLTHLSDSSIHPLTQTLTAMTDIVINITDTITHLIHTTSSSTTALTHLLTSPPPQDASWHTTTLLLYESSVPHPLRPLITLTQPLYRLTRSPSSFPAQFRHIHSSLLHALLSAAADLESAFARLPELGHICTAQVRSIHGWDDWTSDLSSVCAWAEGAASPPSSSSGEMVGGGIVTPGQMVRMLGYLQGRLGMLKVGAGSSGGGWEKVMLGRGQEGRRLRVLVGGVEGRGWRLLGGV